MAGRAAASAGGVGMAPHQPLDVVLAVRRYHDEDSAELVGALYAEQRGTYGYADPVEAPDTDYAPPHGIFLVVYDLGGHPVACGGYRRRGLHGVEVKKMYTRPEHRGRGIGRGLLTELERRAAAAGARTIILETGARNSAAVALYKSMGYEPTGSYVSGRDPCVNRAFAKQVDSRA
jgi:GNAT superfamily N-acetyltransferase